MYARLDAARREHAEACGMRPLFQADADFNHKIVRGIRRREPAVDFQSAEHGGVVGIP